MLQRTRNILEVTARRCYNVSGTSWKLTSWHLLDEVVTYQKDVGSYWRRCFHVSEKSWHLMEEDVTTYQEHRDIWWKKLLQCIRKMLGINEEDVTRYQEHRDICWKKWLQSIRKILEVTARRCYNVSGTSWKLTSWRFLEEVVTTYQEDVGRYWRRCFHV